MNYLAHVYLGADNPELIIGSILGDFVKGALQNRFAPEISKGIVLHRQIDSYTDRHPVTYASKQIVSPSRRRFAGIMVDLFYDHFLAKHWSHYASIPLADFAQYVYQVLLENQLILPTRFRVMLPHMVSQNWLTAYQDVSQISRALDGLSQRLKRQNNLGQSAEELEWHYPLFEQHFQVFFPDLIRFAASCK